MTTAPQNGASHPLPNRRTREEQAAHHLSKMREAHRRWRDAVTTDEQDEWALCACHHAERLDHFADLGRLLATANAPSH